MGLVILQILIGLVILSAGFLLSYTGYKFEFSGFYIGLPTIITSLVLFPPFDKKVLKRATTAVIINYKFFPILIILFGSIYVFEQEKESYFYENKEKIIASAQKHFDTGDYEQATNKLDKYVNLDDIDLDNFYEKIRVTKETNKVLSQLAKVPEEDITNNIKYYKELTALNPDNQEYKEKVTYFTQLAETRKKQAEAERLARIEQAEAQRLAQIEKERQDKKATLLAVIDALPEESTDEKIENYRKLADLFPENQAYPEKINHLRRLANEKQEKKILAELKTVKKGDIDKNLEAYKELARLSYLKNNEFYRKKWKYYQALSFKKMAEDTAHSRWNVQTDEYGNVEMHIKSTIGFMTEPGKYGKYVYPKLFIRCRHDTTSMIIDWYDSIINANNTNYIEYQINNGSTQTHYVTSGYEIATRTFFYISARENAVGNLTGRESIPFIKSLLNKNSLTMWIKPIWQDKREAQFNLSALEVAIKPLRKACNW